MTKSEILYDGPTVNRADAKRDGLKRYFTGKTCPSGHIAQRFTSNGRCVVCAYDQRDKFRADNPEYERLRYIANREDIRRRQSEYHRNNPEIGRIRAMRYYARKKGADGYHTYEDVVKLLKHQKYKCAECGIDISKKYEVDHIMPLALGGSNWPKNLQCLCRNCNARKSAKHPIDWAQENGRLL